jgi:subtilisin family serine protease
VDGISRRTTRGLRKEDQMTTGHSNEGVGSTFEAATDERAVVAKDFVTKGKVSGHGLGAWLPAASRLEPLIPDPTPVKGNPTQAVVAILDTGIRAHEWLGSEKEGIWFVDPDWSATTFAPPEWCPHRTDKIACYGSHAGHATFLAGLVRRAGPNVRLLSYQVMDIHGKAQDERIIEALERIATSSWQRHLIHDQHRQIVAVLMAFGRVGKPNEPDIIKLRAAVAKVVAMGIHIVCAAGNDGTDQLHYPAAFAGEPELSQYVTAVGGLTADHLQRAPFSTYGPWIGAWREAVNRYSAMPWQATALGSDEALPDDERNADAGTPIVDPPDDGLARGETPEAGYAWWSGTSFAAAQYVGELASRTDQGRPPLLPSSPGLTATAKKDGLN